ncbi:hypothetical protein IJC60_03395 [bacterium]|nr:hypothetical protein [bacterium]
MGIAASQARYLSLTARKSNVEFQGQMVNQARTNLANESANIYNEMMKLKAPITPSVYDYYQDTATFETMVNGKNTEFYINSYSESTKDPGRYDVTFKYYKDGVAQVFGGTAALGGLTDEVTIPTVISDIDVVDASISESLKLALSGDKSGNYKLAADAPEFSSSSTVVYNEQAYDEALKKSQLETNAYNQRIQELHARTEKLQIEDRTLELQLRQLDTEQDALQTELESVKKVIEKNVETVFKTFQD